MVYCMYNIHVKKAGTTGTGGERWRMNDNQLQCANYYQELWYIKYMKRINICLQS